MGDELTIALAAIVALAVGIFIGRILLQKFNTRAAQELEEKGKQIIREAELTAENVKKDKILEAKEKYIKIKSEFEDEANRKKSQIINKENKIKQRKKK